MMNLKKDITGSLHWALGLCGFLLLVCGCESEATSSGNSDGKPRSPIVVKGYVPGTVRRLALACAATYAIDQPGGATAIPHYGVIGFRGTPTTIVRDEINAAIVGATAGEVVVAFRGSLSETNNFDDFIETVHDWANDANVELVADDRISPGLMHRGFLDAMNSLYDEMLNAVRKCQGPSQLPVVLTGHSKGGALARLAALRLQKSGFTILGVYTFGSPRTGDITFAKDYAARIRTDFRFENTNDIVPHVPPTKQNTANLLNKQRTGKKFHVHDAYEHVGNLQFFDWEGGILTESPAVESQRTSRLDSALLELQFEQLIDDHSLSNSYAPQLKYLIVK